MTSASPKRKRGPALPLDTKHPSTRLLHEDEYEPGDASPRTKVSRKFGELAIDGGSGLKNVDEASFSQLTPSDHPELSALSAAKTDQEPTTVAKEPAPESPSRSATSTSPLASPFSEQTSTRHKSPPLDTSLSDIFWSDSEITGHNPDDPNDDGYGINGIGFRPTPAMAWSRSQKRKQQLAELKNREAREARQQRSERRKRPYNESDDINAVELSPRKNARVHFEHG
ncbi:hypothetical protein B0A52_01840 [Exophiala mesophila]|uniref:Uncharacterized protein n=1 Tax=Exophiala mesophila TaxID=212818 RepID=A0A438NG66_EXOME|nr:hypothetical protein B0A52_01840 [Exophiala mesophila]